MAQRTQPGAGRREGSSASNSTARTRPARRERLLTLTPRPRSAPPPPAEPRGRQKPPPLDPPRPKTTPAATEPGAPESPSPDRTYPPWQVMLLVGAYAVQFFWVLGTKPVRHFPATLFTHPEPVPAVLSIIGGLALILLWHRCRWAGWIVLLVGLLQLGMFLPWSALFLAYGAWALSEPSVSAAMRGGPAEVSAPPTHPRRATPSDPQPRATRGSGQSAAPRGARNGRDASPAPGARASRRADHREAAA